VAESFKNRVDALTQFASTDDNALADFLADGCKEIINMMPSFELVSVSLEEENVVPSVGLNVRTPVIGVTRDTAVTNGTTHQCRLISMNQRHEAQDENHVLFATETDPVYYLESQSSGINKIKILPKSSLQLGKVTKISYPTPSVSETAIDNFPDKYEYLVVLYASIKSIESLLSSEEDAELYVPILNSLKQDYVSGLSSSGLVSRASK
jgi:hypothetical protein